MKQTSKCVYCGKDAVIFCGHVLRGKEMIIAGWCKRHGNQSKIPSGFSGQWKKSLGAVKYEP